MTRVVRAFVAMRLAEAEMFWTQKARQLSTKLCQLVSPSIGVILWEAIGGSS